MVETINGETINANAAGSYDLAAHEASMTMNMSIGAETLKLPVVLANGTMYMKFPASVAGRLPGNKPWVSMNFNELGKRAGLSGLGSMMNSTSSLSNPGEYLQFLRAAAQGSVNDVGQETIDGIDTTHYQAELDFSKLPSGLPAADRATMQQLVNQISQKATVSDYPADVWIDGSGLVRRLEINLNEVVNGKSVGVEVTENFTNYGTQPAPAIPAPSETTDLFSLLKKSGG